MVISCCFLLCCCWRSLKVRKLWQRSRCARRSHKMQNRTKTTTTRENAAQCNLISARQKSHQKVEWKKSNKYLTLLCDFAFCIANAKKNGVDCSWKRQKDRYRPAVSCGGGSITTTALPDYIVYAVDSERGRAKQQDRYRPAVSCGGGSITKAALPDRRALHCLRSYISFAVASERLVGFFCAASFVRSSQLVLWLSCLTIALSVGYIFMAYYYELKSSHKQLAV